MSGPYISGDSKWPFNILILTAAALEPPIQLCQAFWVFCSLQSIAAKMHSQMPVIDANVGNLLTCFILFIKQKQIVVPCTNIQTFFLFFKQNPNW